MSVKVTTSNGGTEKLESANDFFVKEGHLFVTKSAAGYSENVAVYSPNQWKRAEVAPDKS